MNSTTKDWYPIPIPTPAPGRLAIVPRPRGGDWLEVDVQKWQRLGVDTVVSLLEQDEADDLELGREREALDDVGIYFIQCPVSDRGLPQSVTSFQAVAVHLAECVREAKTVAVHCRQGIGRAPLLAIATLMALGVDKAEAVTAVSAARRWLVPETAEQLHFLDSLNFAPALAETTAI